MSNTKMPKKPVITQFDDRHFGLGHLKLGQAFDQCFFETWYNLNPKAGISVALNISSCPALLWRPGMSRTYLGTGTTWLSTTCPFGSSTRNPEDAVVTGNLMYLDTDLGNGL